MKTILTPLNPEEAPAAAQSSAPPTYGSGVTFDTPGLHYVVGDPVLPVDDGAKIKLSLSARPDDDLPPFCQAISTAMAGKPIFASMSPTALVFDAAVADFSAKLQTQRLTKAAALQATIDKNVARINLDSLLNLRASFVQTASNGNASVIMSAAMPLRPLPSPIGVLAEPMNLHIELNGTPGLMILMWDLVGKAKSYVVQCADATTSARVWSPVKTTNDRKLRLEDMVIGRMYAFRVAAIGGSTGQSAWSAEALRMAA